MRESQHFAVDVLLIALDELLPDVRSHLLDVVLQQLHVAENVVVYALQHIGAATRVGVNLIGVVDQSRPQRLDVHYFTVYVKMRHYVFQSIIHALYFSILPQR